MTDPGSASPANEPVHARAIEALARETRLPVERVSDVYAAELTRLMAGARIREYLPVLTSRRVRVMLRAQLKPGQAG